MLAKTQAAKVAPQKLAKSLTLTLAVLYGLGVTIGAGIYVLVGIAAGRSGMHAPLAFIGAAIVMAFSAASQFSISRSVTWPPQSWLRSLVVAVHPSQTLRRSSVRRRASRAGLHLPDRAARLPAKGQGQTILRAGKPQMARPADRAGHVAARRQGQDMAMRAMDIRTGRIAKAVDQHRHGGAGGKCRQALLQRGPVICQVCALAVDRQKRHGLFPYLGDTGVTYTSGATGG